ncbi:bifunctional phosphoribosylaminoimidazolecarboxamide formyltransferase/IMP cyclohydrolase [Planctomyces sp. SH-PL62]|uniref:bifunctional phosphoribosylaminoimidazolecarboxamide formyltransferase/IMP cyclohydrolase n=1 Tax=Planctomyces sp. SH-PL62 TaxID=1636152 RepID=UPI00078DF0A2|nr:bifunctional phosphoribosylaminoimidazolecarboxamide formyltransferase/IMP cyclohydrolase [Planctomyces sp. SH-PL62]AMV36804.1 Bifunctional purine biosynthesis protein PurH [Planctomyces sp. SH-PL62]
MAKPETQEGWATIRRAVLSVSDKQGLVELATALADAGVELIASGGTRFALAQAGLPVIEVADYTGQPEILDGRVKTLHPRIHGGILARRDVPEHLETLAEAGMEPIDLVVVNLYPFEATIARPDCSFEHAVENIDIGGPSLIRGAAKNHDGVAVLTDPGQYERFLAEFRESGGTRIETRKRLAREAFAQTGAYDRAIAAYLEKQETAATATATAGADEPPPSLDLHFPLRQALRYGENPHQKAALYIDPDAVGPNLATARILHGKEPSYNNLLDLDSALRLVRLFDGPAACILKHNNPCGAAIADDPATAFEAAYEGDPVSAFGGIVGLNRPVDLATAELMCKPGRFLEAILAPGFEPEAIALLTTKPTWKNSVRLVDLGAPIGPTTAPPSGWDLRRIEGGLLAQGWDEQQADPTAGEVKTKRPPTPEELRDLDFAWKICAMVKSNAIVVAKGGRLLGVGAGQMSRLDSVRIAVEKGGEAVRGGVLASDAFFPFRDGPDVAAAAGIAAIIQPGGSKRDAETVDACDEHGMAMIFTGRRHFRH